MSLAIDQGDGCRRIIDLHDKFRVLVVAQMNGHGAVGIVHIPEPPAAILVKRASGDHAGKRPIRNTPLLHRARLLR